MRYLISASWSFQRRIWSRNRFHAVYCIISQLIGFGWANIVTPSYWKYFSWTGFWVKVSKNIDNAIRHARENKTQIKKAVVNSTRMLHKNIKTPLIIETYMQWDSEAEVSKTIKESWFFFWNLHFFIDDEAKLWHQLFSSLIFMSFLRRVAFYFCVSDFVCLFYDCGVIYKIRFFWKYKSTSRIFKRNFHARHAPSYFYFWPL